MSPGVVADSLHIVRIVLHYQYLALTRMEIKRAERTSAVTKGCNNKTHIRNNSGRNMHVLQQIKCVTS